MALSTTQYGYIIDPMVPFTDEKGKTIKNGFVRVFVAGSSTPVITYRNFDGAANQDLIELDNSGRTKTSVIGSKGLTYKVCVYDQLHSQESPILTVDKVSVIGANITAGAGATVVTGLDGFRTKPDGFVDASVIGTDGYVALDHTLVTDDLDTDAKVTAVENDRYIPLLNKDVNDPDSKMTLGRLGQWVLGKVQPGSVTASSVYPTLQDAITDAANISVGDLFETNGFWTNGDGGAARYLVSNTGTANGYNIIELSSGKYAILQVHDFIHPECYGAKGDNSTDNTAVFNAIFSDASVKSIMLSANKTYKIQFKNWTLRNITLVGADKMSSRLSQMNININKPFATIGIGVEIGNICFICGGGNTQPTGLFHFGNDENGTFQPFIGSIIHDIYAYCVQNIIGFDFSYTQSGSHTIRIEHCKLDAPGIGIRVTDLNDLTHQSYLSNFYFNDITVAGPYDYGFSFDKSQAGGMMISHGLLTQCSVQLSRNGSCGYKLSYGDYTILNPCVFVENTSGEVFSVELDLDKLYVPVVPIGILNVIGGILEGTIKNKEFLHSINWNTVDFVEEQNFPEGISGHRVYSRHLNTTPNSILKNSFSEIKTGIILTNATSSEDSGIYGKTIKLVVTDFEESQVTIKIPINLPNVEKLTSVFLFDLSNGYKFLASGSLPSVALTNSSNESILDALGPDPNGRRNRITMDDLEKYYALVGTFDISEADRTKTWFLQVNIPTIFSTSVENAYISILGINLYEDYVKPTDISISKVNSIYWNL